MIRGFIRFGRMLFITRFAIQVLLADKVPELEEYDLITTAVMHMEKLRFRAQIFLYRGSADRKKLLLGSN